METVLLARNAMATRFELVLHGENPVALRAAGEEALDEICRIENQLSLYRPATEIAAVNARAAQESVQVSPEVFSLLELAQRLHAETDGAFDITIAPLVRCWGFMNARGEMPLPEAVAAARELVGMQHVQLNASRRTVRFARAGVMLDLGAIGKGYAVGRAAEFLRDAGVTSALIHGGTSTVYAIGHPPDAAQWSVAIERPPEGVHGLELPTLPEVFLQDEALSMSAPWGRFFQKEGELFGHVLDARNGRPVRAAVVAAVILPSATETDALSTALMVRGDEGASWLKKIRPACRGLLVSGAPGQWRLDNFLNC